jgi:hypothetical protein
MECFSYELSALEEPIFPSGTAEYTDAQSVWGVVDFNAKLRKI